MKWVYAGLIAAFALLGWLVYWVWGLWKEFREETPYPADGGISSGELAKFFLGMGWFYMTEGKAAALAYGQKLEDYYKARQARTGRGPSA